MFSATAVPLLVLTLWQGLPAVPFPNTPHSAYGTVSYTDGTHPDQLEITASITSRPQDILHQNSVGCGYDNQTGTWYIGCANFESSWQIGDTLQVILNDLLGNVAETRIVLTGAPTDKAEDTILAKPAVTVTVTTSPAGLTVFVNDTAFTAPAVFSWEAGTQQRIAVDSLYEPQPGARHRFLNWNDSPDRERRLTVPTSSAVITAYFASEYYLEIISEFGQPDGSGWYSQGETAEISITTPDYLENGQRAFFNGWSGTGEGAYSGSDGTAAVIMNGPVTERASWTIQYRLSLSVTPPAGGNISVSPSGTWFDTGTEIALHALPDTALQFSFAAWQGDISSTDNPLSLTINGPLAVQAAFSNNDTYAPVIDFIYPPLGAKGVRRNSQLYFRIYDPVPYSGINLSTITTLINSDTLMYNGLLLAEDASLTLTEDRFLTVMLDMDGHVAPGANGITVSGSDFMANGFSKISIFSVVDDAIEGKSVNIVDGQGGTISIPNALGSKSAGLSIPFGVYELPFHLTTGTCSAPGNLPENAESAGAVIYLGPVGHVFPDSVILILPYTQETMNEANAAHPLEIPILFYSLTADTWTEISAYRITSDYIYVRIGATGIYCFGDRHLTHVDSDPFASGTTVRTAALRQNYPNPFNNATRIPFSLSRESRISILMYDIKGRVVRHIIDDVTITAGDHEITWDGMDNNGAQVPSGMYMYSLFNDRTCIQTRKLVISK